MQPSTFPWANEWKMCENCKKEPNGGENPENWDTCFGNERTNCQRWKGVEQFDLFTLIAVIDKYIWMKKGRKRHRGLPWERDCMDDLMTRNPLLFSTPPLPHHGIEKHPERWTKRRQLCSMGEEKRREQLGNWQIISKFNEAKCSIINALSECFINLFISEAIWIEIENHVNGNGKFMLSDGIWWTMIIVEQNNWQIERN